MVRCGRYHEGEVNATGRGSLRITGSYLIMRRFPAKVHAELPREDEKECGA